MNFEHENLEIKKIFCCNKKKKKKLLISIQILQNKV